MDSIVKYKNAFHGINRTCLPLTYALSLIIHQPFSSDQLGVFFYLQPNEITVVVIVLGYSFGPARSDVAAENLVQVEVDSLGAVVLAVPVVDDVKVVREGLAAVDQPLVEEVLQLLHGIGVPDGFPPQNGAGSPVKSGDDQPSRLAGAEQGVVTVVGVHDDVGGGTVQICGKAHDHVGGL